MQALEDEVEPHDPQDVYLDWSSARLLPPIVAAVAVLGLGLILLLRALGGGGQESGPPLEDGDQVAAEDTDPLDQAMEQAQAFAAGLAADSLTGQEFAFEELSEVRDDIDRTLAGLGPVDLTVDVGPLRLDDLRAVGPVDVGWELDDGTTFSTAGRLRLVRTGDDWLVDWDTTVFDERLTPGDVLIRERVLSPRAPVLGQDGFELVGQRPTIDVGVITSNVASIESLTSRLTAMLDIDGPETADLLRRSPSDDITVVDSVRAEVIESRRAEFQGLPGVVLVDNEAPLTPYDGYGRALLGWVGEATAEIIERSPDHFAAGDIVGRSGLQAAHNEQLSGLPGVRVRIDRNVALRDGQGRVVPADAEINIVHQSVPQEPEPIRTTIDHRVQVAAEKALGRLERPSSLVAVRASTGEVLAVANGPAAATENRAMTGRYSPGSAFEVVTALAVLERGADPEQQVDCPGSVEVDGNTFANIGNDGHGRVRLVGAFARSCGTSFVELGLALDASTLSETARRLGVGAQYRLGTDGFAGSVPAGGSRVERASTAVGQGQVVVSPLSMAVMAASVASVAFRPPTLVLVDGADSPPTEAVVLESAPVARLQWMMGQLVDWGTGSTARQAGGGAVHGKTGTAVSGSGDSRTSDAWFVGYQDDLAFAVLVEGGGRGGAVAGPVVADFLTRLAEQR